MTLQGKVAVITGAGSGLGAQTAQHLVERRQMKAVLLDLPGSKAGELVQRLGDRVLFIPVDVTDERGVAGAVRSASEHWGRLDACVNVAGVPGTMRLLNRDGSVPEGDVFESTLRVNLTGTFHVMRHCASAFARNPLGHGERGVIVNVASIAGLEGSRGHVAYSASKSGVIGMMLPAARELCDWGIRIVTIAPGMFDTPMLHTIEPRTRDKMAASTLWPKRLGEADEFAALVAHVLENRYLNAEVIRIDGGARLG
jgi:3-hydroxyacyl-CoA dehydrogenase/3-hydroxy-2-methylbutyryl-CoA dehydrogenase